MRLVTSFTILILWNLSSCNMNSITHDLFASKHKENSGNDIGMLRPINIFEGTWSWIKTEGSGIAGPYVHDPNTAGYSLTYNFYDFTHVKIYRNDTLENKYTYSIQVSDSTAEQTLTLTDSTGNAITYLWNVENKNNDDFLYLTNPILCCDNSFTMYFKRTGNAQYKGE